MLAEKKSKQKWSEDPRNVAWSSDKNRYGFQMLEKMGWANGNGLGRKQNGNTSHVKIKKRKHNLGLGAKETHDKDWIGHQEDFNNLLSALHQHAGNAELRSEEQNKKAMLEVAKASRKRVFYKKFIRSKDTSQYSETDLACIFGTVTSQSAPATPQNQSDDEVHSDESSISCPTASKNSSVDAGFVTYTSKQNIHDYFARRMKELKGGKPNEQIEEDKKGDPKMCPGSECKSVSEEKENKQAKKKKKKKKRTLEEVEECEKGEKEEEKQCEGRDVPKKKKKKKKNRAKNEQVNTEDDVEFLVNGETRFDSNGEHFSKEHGDFSKVEDEVKRKKSKKKKSKKSF